MMAGSVSRSVGADGAANVPMRKQSTGCSIRRAIRIGGKTLNVGVHSPMMRALQHANFTFAKKISHTADSQDQRHRMVPGSRPLLTLCDTR